MSRLGTGKQHELHGHPDVIRKIWPEVKQAAPDAVMVTAASDGVAVIGTDNPDGVAVGKRLSEVPLVYLDRRAGGMVA